MTVTWCCPECQRPVRMRLHVEKEQRPNGTWRVTLDAALHVNAHLHSHQRGTS